ncbi:methyltransferase, FxLD system [Actinacidiphila rubida]|uniref:Protein-L-isoaspartate O-methyltransferase n=1 Tax=Actinacidiphila rubida TaxID=310780 RepID=A0A1H8TT42_9ACTN|nr:methyltransferase, FxLD system [Actinacidiphila rubida]SEO93598.1 protein-L-isoaspartate(D-aspartate) O-methyltransferase [Actinacidiphila rubida]
MGYTRADWSNHYTAGNGFRPLGATEKALLAEHAPAPSGGGRALDAGCGTGELAAFLASLGYTVDAVDFAEGAVDRARAEHAAVESVRWLCLDLDRDDPAPLHEDGYDLVTLRLMYPFLARRMSVAHALGERLRPGGALVVITPVVEHTPDERRSIALDEDEIALLTEGWETVERLEADRLAVLVLRGPCHTGTRAVERKRPPAGPAVTGALAVVTDAAGRVLLGRSRRGMWELPGGRNEGSESFEVAAVRELAEETGLAADVENAHVVTMLADSIGGVPRLTAVVRITAWSGRLANPEADKFDRWEFVDLHVLSCVGAMFVPAAQALDAVWPGVLPDLPPVVSYPLAVEQPPVPGESAEAVRLRQAMAQTVNDGGWAPSEPVRDALRTVPRHRFAPEVNLANAYDGGDRAVITRRDETGRAISSVSAAWLQADMIETLSLKPGATVFEAGSGGYNAELIAHVSGPDGRVVTVDIDPWVARRTRRFTTESGSGRVSVVEADAALGAPAHLVPRGGFDRSVITYNCWDIAPAWREQLAEGGRLVMPLEIGGYTRAIAFERHGQVLHARHFTYCGFVRDQGQQARTIPVVSLLDGGLTLRFEHGTAAGTDGLEEALRGERHDVATGVTMGAGVYFGSLQLYVATTLPGFCRLAAHQNADQGVTGIAKDRDAPAIVGDASLAYLIAIQTKDGDRPEDKEWEWHAHAFGEQGPQLAEQLAVAVRAWDRHVRADDNNKHADPVLTAHPADTPDDLLPAGHVLDKEHCRLVIRWPGHDAQVPRPVRPRAEMLTQEV